MIPMRKTSHTWLLLSILFILDYSGINLEANPPKSPAAYLKSSLVCSKTDDCSHDIENNATK
jgi:hypothetical protein